MINKYSKVVEIDVEFFTKIVGKNNIYFDKESLKTYSTDHT